MTKTEFKGLNQSEKHDKTVPVKENSTPKTMKGTLSDKNRWIHSTSIWYEVKYHDHEEVHIMNLKLIGRLPYITPADILYVKNYLNSKYLVSQGVVILSFTRNATTPLTKIVETSSSTLFHGKLFKDDGKEGPLCV